MNRQSRRAVLFGLSFLVVVILSLAGFCLRSQRNQYRIDRQLIVALKMRDYKEAGRLVRAGADPNTIFKEPPAPSLRQFWNSLFRYTKITKSENPSAFLIACGAFWRDDDGEGKASGPDDPLLVETMVQHHADMNARDEDGWTPLVWAVVQHQPKTVSVLLDHGANVDLRDSSGCTPLMTASKDDPEMVATLLVHGPDVNIEDANGDTALNHAVSSSITLFDSKVTRIIVRQLLTHGANPNLPNKQSITPIQFAQQNERTDLVALLRRAGAKK